MLRFIIRRIIIIVPMLFIVVSLTWALVRLAPGNFYSGEKKIAPAVEANLREKYGLNKPWYVQYSKVLKSLALPCIAPLNRASRNSASATWTSLRKR